MIINRSGVMIRMAVEELRVMEGMQGSEAHQPQGEGRDRLGHCKVPGGKEEEIEGASNEEGANDGPAENS